MSYTITNDKNENEDLDRNCPKFMGRNIYRYHVINQNGISIYTCITTTRTQDEILGFIEGMFGDYYLPCRIFCNGNLIKRIGLKGDWKLKVIKDKLTGKRYKSMLDMAEDLEVSLKRVKTLLERQMRYEWEK